MAIFKTDAARGICTMILGAGVLSMNDAVSKYMVESYPIGQILCLRQVAALVAIGTTIGMSVAVIAIIFCCKAITRRKREKSSDLE